jgi:hypothetical protein
VNESWMPSEHRTPEEERLDALFRAYHVACEPREVSANFMPELWQKIEKVQSATFSFRRIAKGFVTAAAALSLALALVAFFPSRQTSPSPDHASYVEALAAHNEALAAHNSSDGVEYVLDLIHPDSLDETAEEI